MTALFGRDVNTIGKNTSNVLKEELHSLMTINFATVQHENGRGSERNTEYYNRDIYFTEQEAMELCVKQGFDYEKIKIW